MASCSGDRQGLLLLSSLVAIEIARQVSEEQREVLAAFFTILGDSLALLSIPSAQDDCPAGEATASSGA